MLQEIEVDSRGQGQTVELENGDPRPRALPRESRCLRRAGLERPAPGAAWSVVSSVLDAATLLAFSRLPALAIVSVPPLPAEGAAGFPSHPPGGAVDCRQFPIAL